MTLLAINRLVTPVAKRRRCGLFALAEMTRFINFNFKQDWAKFRIAVFAITKRLVARQATRAIRIFFSTF